MNIKRTMPFAISAFVALAALGAVAHAEGQGEDKRDAAMLAGMKVTLTQAIATAEQQSGGHAVGADIGQEKGVTQIAVEVVGPQGTKTLMVDAQTGKVTATHDGGQDTEDND